MNWTVRLVLISAAFLLACGDATDGELSLMHYGPTSFSVNGKPTLTRKDGTIWKANFAGPTTNDVTGVSGLYASTCSQTSTHLSNGGFEFGNTGWSVPAGVISQQLSTLPAHNGTWRAWMGGKGIAHRQVMWQEVKIPQEACSATLPVLRADRF